MILLSTPVLFKGSFPKKHLPQYRGAAENYFCVSRISLRFHSGINLTCAGFRSEQVG